MSNHHAVPLRTEVIRDDENVVTDVHIHVGGWRIDVAIPHETAEGDITDLSVRIANEAVDGDWASWCAVAYSDALMPSSIHELNLRGTEGLRHATERRNDDKE